MQTEYYLIIEQALGGGRTLRVMDDYRAIDLLVSDAADLEAGEYDGRWAGALELAYDRDGRLADCRMVLDLAGKVHAELMRRPGWRRRQAAAEKAGR